MLPMIVRGCPNLQDFSDGVTLPESLHEEPFPLAGTSVDRPKARVITPAELEDFETKHGDQLAVMDAAIANTNIGKIALEGGHIYTNETVGDGHRRGLELTAYMRAHLQRKVANVVNVLFVDDFHDPSEDFDINGYVQLAAEHGWSIDHIVKEASMVPLAKVVIETLRSVSNIYTEQNGLMIKRGSRQVELMTRQGGEFSCAVLDAALSVLKLRELGAHGIVNVLPRDYHQQQANVRTILRGCLGNERIPFFNFYFDPTNHQAIAGRPGWAC